MSESGEFVRDTRYLDGRITVDGRDGWPVAADRYRLVVARGCPWANRTMIVRRLLGLEPALSMGICGPELSTRRYLCGDTITEADIRLWPTLVRFDAVYHGHFKCNRNKLTEMPVLWAYARDLFQTTGFGDTINFEQTKQHYYRVHTNLNPSRIVPAGPDLSGWVTPHGREQLGGRPFGDGTPPNPPPPAERVPNQLGQ